MYYNTKKLSNSWMQNRTKFRNQLIEHLCLHEWNSHRVSVKIRVFYEHQINWFFQSVYSIINDDSSSNNFVRIANIKLY